LYGLQADEVKNKFKTSTASNNTINPVWNGEPFVFKVSLPDLGEFQVKAED
jgi:hypothetical protein